MDQPDEALSAEDRYVFQKLDEAHEQYEIYLSIKAEADIAALRELAELANTGTDDPYARFKPQPLTMTFRSSS